MTDVQIPNDSPTPSGSHDAVIDAPGWDVYAPVGTAVSEPAPPATDPGAAAPDRPAPGRAGRLVRGRPEDPAWVRPALLALLVGTGILYLWGLGASGWGNSFYSAAVQAGTKSW